MKLLALEAPKVIKRKRHKKGPKEKLLIVPFTANMDDARFQHLFETLEVESDLMSEHLSNLHGFSGMRLD